MCRAHPICWVGHFWLTEVHDVTTKNFLNGHQFVCNSTFWTVSVFVMRRWVLLYHCARVCTLLFFDLSWIRAQKESSSGPQDAIGEVCVRLAYFKGSLGWAPGSPGEDSTLWDCERVSGVEKSPNHRRAVQQTLLTWEGCTWQWCMLDLRLSQW